MSHRVKDSDENIQFLESLYKNNNNLGEYSLDKFSLTYGERLCLSRCHSKIMNVKEVVDNKLKENLEFPPILFN